MDHDAAVRDTSGLQWEFDQPDLILALAIEVWCDEAVADFALAMPVDLSPLDDERLLTSSVRPRHDLDER